MLHLALFFALAQEPRPAPAAAPVHGRVAWTDGSFADVLRVANERRTLVMIDFWTKTCGWCRTLDRETWSDLAVVSATAPLACIAIDGDTTDGAELARRFGVTTWPSIVFVEADGALRESLQGYLPPAEFLAELRRVVDGDGTLTEMTERLAREGSSPFVRAEAVERLLRARDAAGVAREGAALKELVARGLGFDASDPWQRARLAQALRMLGDEDGARAQAGALHALGASAVAFLEHRRTLDLAVRAAVSAAPSARAAAWTALRQVAERETIPGLRFDALVALRDLFDARALSLDGEERIGEARTARRESRTTARAAWGACPTVVSTGFARALVAAHLRDERELDETERAALVEIARASLAADTADPLRHEHLARALYVQGHADQAVAALQRALDLAPERRATRARLERWERELRPPR